MSRSVRDPDYRRMSVGGVVEGHIPEELAVRDNEAGRREYWDHALRRWVLILTPEEAKARYDPVGRALVQAIHDRKNERHDDV